jgi:BirA family biotin operon repressor/biotin-[acetyl-CoA-carboxylase] ligase
MQFDELVSTNSFLKEHYQGKSQFTVVTADFQSAGRGQRGNSWESEPGKNLLMSMLYYPEVTIRPQEQFRISKAVAVATVEVLEDMLASVPHPEVCIKWPNDIYIGNGKVAGVLIENTIADGGRIAMSIIGIGLNVNQLEFRSDAPNPVSLIQYLGMETDLDELTRTLRNRIGERLLEAEREGEAVNGERPEGVELEGDLGESLDELYKSHLWRRDGFYPYMSLVASAAPAPTAIPAQQAKTEAADSGEESADNIFDAEIVDVAADGCIVMRLRSGELRSFYFKEVAPVLVGF